MSHEIKILGASLEFEFACRRIREHRIHNGETECCPLRVSAHLP
jgi:hypothetical protein